MLGSLRISEGYTPSNNILVLPADLVAETADSAVLAARAKTQNTQSLGNNDSLLFVVRRGDTLEDLEALHSGGTAGSLVGDHAADSLVEDTGRSAEVEGTTASGVETSDLAEVGVVLDCRSDCRSATVSKERPCGHSWLPQHRSIVANVPLSLAIEKSLITSKGSRGLNVRFARKNSPEMLRASHLTTTIF